MYVDDRSQAYFIIILKWSLFSITSQKAKHVEFYFKNKFEKLLHLVGFIIRILSDAVPLNVKFELPSLFNYVAKTQNLWLLFQK